MLGPKKEIKKEQQKIETIISQCVIAWAMNGGENNKRLINEQRCHGDTQLKPHRSFFKFF